MLRLAAAAFVALTLAACVAPPPLIVADVDAADIVELDHPLECTGKAACDDLWRRAQIWVLNNSGYKIQVATEVVIETYNPGLSSTTFAIRLTRELQPDGTERMEIMADCGKYPMCHETRPKLTARFRRELRRQVAAAKAP